MTKKYDFSLGHKGPLHVAEGVKQPGYEYCWVGDLPGQIEMYESWGYEFVKDTHKVGDKTASDSTPIGSCLTVKSKCGQTMYFMKIPADVHEQLMNYRNKMGTNLLTSLNRLDGVPEHLQVGAVTIDNRKI